MIAGTGNEVHEHIGTHQSHVLFLQNPLHLRPICQNHLDFLGGLLVRAGRRTGAVAEEHGAAFVGHSGGGEEGAGKGTCLHRREGQPGFLEHFPDTGLGHFLSVLHKPRGEFI